jgi:hypothetical protein
MHMIKYVNQTIINLSGLAVDCTRTLNYSGNRQVLNASTVTSSLKRGGMFHLRPEKLRGAGTAQMV